MLRHLHGIVIHHITSHHYTSSANMGEIQKLYFVCMISQQTNYLTAGIQFWEFHTCVRVCGSLVGVWVDAT